MWLNKNYMELRKAIQFGFSENVMNYTTNKAHFFMFETIMKDHKDDVEKGNKEVDK